MTFPPIYKGFPGSSVGKESTCKAGDPNLIPGLRRSPGEGISHPLQYPWASLVAQMVKNPSAICENLGSTPGLGRSPGGGYGNPLQYSCRRKKDADAAPGDWKHSVNDTQEPGNLG